MDFAYVLTRGAAAFATPLGLALGLGAAAWLLGAAGRRRAALALLGACLGVLWLCSAPRVATSLGAALERRYPARPITELPEASAIVVLGGGVGRAVSPRLFPDLNRSADRLLHGAQLYRAGKAPLMILSGGAQPWAPDGPTEADAMAELLLTWGVPEAALVREERSRTTRENALGVKAIAEERALGPVLLVTSALHMPRALATFRAAGIDAVPAPTDFEVVDDGLAQSALGWLPSAEALDASTRAWKEILGARVYAWRGWIE